MSGLFKNVDCIELYVSDLDDGIDYYCGSMGLKLLWRADTSAGLGMEDGVAEVVLQTGRTEMNVDFLVESVAESIEKITGSGGKLIYGPFDIPIGKCAVVQDKWENEYVILDMSKGRYVINEKKNVIGVSKGS
jgi:lactoylglutathione lyase